MFHRAPAASSIDLFIMFAYSWRLGTYVSLGGGLDGVPAITLNFPGLHVMLGLKAWS